jgi:hypothetical protein
VLSNIGHEPWWILVAGFWLFAMANFVKDGGAVAHIWIWLFHTNGLYGGFLALRHP